MANNNDAIFNAAIAGFYGGLQAGRQSGDASAGTANAANAFAVEVDAAIPVDGAMDAAKANLCQALCTGAIAGRYPRDTTAADYSAIAAAIAATYAEGATKLV